MRWPAAGVTEVLLADFFLLSCNSSARVLTSSLRRQVARHLPAPLKRWLIFAVRRPGPRILELVYRT